LELSHFLVTVAKIPHQFGTLVSIDRKFGGDGAGIDDQIL